MLVELVSHNPASNPLQPEVILVQSQGMAQWLKLAMAEQIGVAANVHFPLPAAFIWTLFEQVLDDVPNKSAFDKESMTWKIQQLLPEYLELPEFAPLHHYLADSEALKQHQLAEKIADIFDGYLVYRPDWIASWENNQAVAELGDEQQWQPILWRALCDYTHQLGEQPYHRANLYERLLEALPHAQDKLASLPQRLFVFGISSLPPKYIEALHAIGQYIDVHFMFTNPCRYYWGDVRDRSTLAKIASRTRQQIVWHGDHSVHQGNVSALKGSVEENIADETETFQVGNGLLASMGKLGRDNHYILSQLESNEIEAFVELERESLLQHIQADILNLSEFQDDHKIETSTHKGFIATDDTSLTVHACHSAMREVEVLHDQLLQMFERSNDLEPKDIVVMVPDINAYTPAIRAVFGSAPQERYIPFSISDRTTSEANPILNAFFQLLNLPKSRALASELLELLETPAILRKFHLTPDDFQNIKYWVKEVGVRWGLTEHTAQQMNLEKHPINTWKYGIERMLLGYAIPQDAGLFEFGSKSLAGYDQVQGAQVEAIGELALFVERLVELEQTLSQPYIASEWTAHLIALIDDFFEPQLDEELVLNSVVDSLLSWQQLLEDMDYSQSIPLDVVNDILLKKLSTSRVSQRFLAGQVNFCTLMPMRSIPFKVICLLGMNDGVYPPTELIEGFDLMRHYPRIGDRSRRIDGRYMFLEALLSAQEQLYISYVGRSIEDKQELIPSILVSELLEYCQQNYCLQQDELLDVDLSGERLMTRLCFEHSMTPYSHLAFTAQNPSYVKEWLAVANAMQQPSLLDSHHLLSSSNEALPSIANELAFPYEIDFESLKRFWTLPVKRFVNQRLGVYFDELSDQVEDNEPFQLTHLSSYIVRQELLDACVQYAQERGMKQLDDEGVLVLKQQFIKQKRALGVLAVNAFGELDIVNEQQHIQHLLAEVLPLISTKEEQVEFRLSFTPWDDNREVIMSGWLGHIFSIPSSPLQRILYRVGSIRSKDILDTWLAHLALHSSGNSMETCFLGINKQGDIEKLSFAPLTQTEAMQQLNTMVSLFFKGLDQPFAYFPKAILKAAKAWYIKENMDKASLQAVMQKEFESQYGELSDPYVMRTWQQWESVSEECYQGLEKIFMPIVYAAKEFDLSR